MLAATVFIAKLVVAWMLWCAGSIASDLAHDELSDGVWLGMSLVGSTLLFASIVMLIFFME
jgi:hypothetical protein